MKISAKLITVIMLAFFISIALYLRIYLPYARVFSGDWIKFTSFDAYYHMSVVDNLIHNVPHPVSYQFFDWLLAGTIWVIGLGSATEHTVDVVGVYFPAILGALTVIPVYFIGKELFGRWPGIISAGLIALLPGEFLGRSILGFTDHHVAETVFSTVTILFLILAIKAARQRGLRFIHLYRRDWTKIYKPAIYSLLAGIFLGVYVLTWRGALLFVLIICAYFIIQFIIDHLKHKSSDHLCLVGVLLFSVALLISLPVCTSRLHLASLVIALLIPPVLNGVSRLMASEQVRAYYPLALVALGLAGLAILRMVNPPLLSSMLGAFTVFAPTAISRTTLEMRPFLFIGDSFTLAIAWGNFTTGSLLSLISFGILIYFVIKKGRAEQSLLVVWTLVILIMTLAQRRFAYYLTINVAVLTGYMSVFVFYITRLIVDYLRGERIKCVSWQVLQPWANIDKPRITSTYRKPKEVQRKKDGRKTGYQSGYQSGFRITSQHVTAALATLIIFFLFFFPNITPAVGTASRAGFAPSNAWVSSLSWLKENSPESASYRVMAWWDYGYWITRIAHRIPNANPGQATQPVTSIASFFTAQDENSANEVRQELGSAYIIIDYETTTAKFYAITEWAGNSPEEFFDVYYLPQKDKLTPVYLFYPEYYRSMAIRLYYFAGKAVTPQKTWVVSFIERVNRKGQHFKQVIDITPFPTYEEALDYVKSQKSANHRIVGKSSFISPVPLEAVTNYKLIHNSNTGVMEPGTGIVVPEVRIFKYINNGLE